MSPGTELYGFDWGFVGTLFVDPHSFLQSVGFALVEGLVAGAIAVALTVMYHRR